jgi:hypothetical protein
MEGEGWDLCRFSFSLLYLSFPLDLSPPCLGEADQVAAAVAARGWGSFSFASSSSLSLFLYLSGSALTPIAPIFLVDEGADCREHSRRGCQPRRVSAAAITALMSIPSRSMPPNSRIWRTRCFLSFVLLAT